MNFSSNQDVFSFKCSFLKCLTIYECHGKEIDSLSLFSQHLELTKYKILILEKPEEAQKRLELRISGLFSIDELITQFSHLLSNV